MRAYTKVAEKVKAEKFGIQATLIINAMSETEPRTVPAITNAIRAQLVTRQDPERVTAFYISTWKKKGIVKLHEIASDGTVTAGAAEPARVEVAEAPPEAAVNGTPGELPNLSGLKLSVAVLEVLKFRGGKASADETVETLNKHGYEFKLNQVNSALQALEARKAVNRGDDGVFQVA